MEKMSIDEPRACAKKYFNVASEEYWLSFFITRGIKDIKLSSNPTHALNQDVEETDIKVPETSVKKNMLFEIEK